MPTHYETLQVAETADDAVIRASYRVLVQRYHPDRYEPREEAERRTIELIDLSVLSDTTRASPVSSTQR